MDTFSKKISSLKNHALSSEEREELRGRVVAFMDASAVAVRNDYVSRHDLGEARSKSLVAVTKLKRKRMISIIVAVLFGLSGGVSYAAQSSLPGDTLYPVKVHVNEGIEGAFHVGAKAEAEFARKELERRAAETEALVAQQRLDAEAKATLVAHAQSHLNLFAEAKQDLEADGATTTAREEQVKTDHTMKANADAFLKLGIMLDEDNTVSGGTSMDGEEGGALGTTVSNGVSVKLPVKASTTLKVRARSLLENILGNDATATVRISGKATGSAHAEGSSTATAQSFLEASTTSATNASAHSGNGSSTTGSVDAEIHVNADGTVDAAPVSVSGSAEASGSATTHVGTPAPVVLPVSI